MEISLAEKRCTRYESPRVIVVSVPIPKEEQFIIINEIDVKAGGEVRLVEVKIPGTLES